MAHTCDPNLQEAEAGGPPQVQVQPGLQYKKKNPENRGLNKWLERKKGPAAQT